MKVISTENSMKVLNLYAGIGGNRKLWRGVEVTSVEYNPEIAAIYQEYFPNDTVIVADAHEYLLQNYKDFDFIWSSPPCITHSRLRHAQKNKAPAMYPDANLWQEIIFLNHHSICPFVVENVKPYYDVFIQPTIEIDRHLFWSNFHISSLRVTRDCKNVANVEGKKQRFGFDISTRRIKAQGNHDIKGQILRNLVNPEIGLSIINQIKKNAQPQKVEQMSFLEIAV